MDEVPAESVRKAYQRRRKRRREVSPTNHRYYNYYSSYLCTNTGCDLRKVSYMYNVLRANTSAPYVEEVMRYARPGSQYAFLALILIISV